MFKGKHAATNQKGKSVRCCSRPLGPEGNLSDPREMQQLPDDILNKIAPFRFVYLVFTFGRQGRRLDPFFVPSDVAGCRSCLCVSTEADLIRISIQYVDDAPKLPFAIQCDFKMI